MTAEGSGKHKAQVLVVDDDAAFRECLRDELRRSGYGVSEAGDGTSARAALLRDEPDIIMLDLRMPEEDGMSILEDVRKQGASEVIVLTGHGSVETAIRAMKLGAADYLTKPCDLDELELTIERTLQTRNLKARTELLERGLMTSEVEMIGGSLRFMEMIREVEQAAHSASAVLVYGESGTGKELVARKLHQLGLRRGKPFVVVDCAALSDELMHSELFGHEKGAYTGANGRKHGMFEVAEGGSLCLDEVAEVSPRVQAKLLRVLDGGTFRRMGGTQEIHVNVRIISSTNRRLEELVSAGAFREDLYYRLSPLTISVPPLRERGEDVALLAQHFFARAVRRLASPPTLEPSALDALKSYPWYGNVRELLGVIERLVVFGSGNTVGREEVDALLRNRESPVVTPDDDLPLAEVERRHIDNILRRCDGHRAEAARILGISERSLYRKIGSLS